MTQLVDHAALAKLEESSSSTFVDECSSSSDEESSACSLYITQQTGNWEDCSTVSSTASFPCELTLGDEDCEFSRLDLADSILDTSEWGGVDSESSTMEEDEGEYGVDVGVNIGDDEFPSTFASEYGNEKDEIYMRYTKGNRPSVCINAPSKTSIESYRVRSEIVFDMNQQLFSHVMRRRSHGMISILEQIAATNRQLLQQDSFGGRRGLPRISSTASI
jgi:hypothetical protein